MFRCLSFAWPILKAIVLLAAALTLAGCGPSGTARISYIQGGEYAHLFENTDEPLRIAVLPIKVISNIGDVDASFWAAHIRNDIDEQLKRAARKSRGKLVLVAPPEDADEILEHADRQAAGLVETDTPGQRSALVGRDLFIVGQLRFSVEVIEVAQQRYVRSGSSGYMQTFHVPVRTTSAECTLRGVSRRGTSVVTFNSHVTPVRTALVGVPAAQADDLRRAAAQVGPQFVCLFFAEQTEEFVPLQSSSAEPCEQAVSILGDPARDDPASLEEAVSLLKAAIQEDPRDHRAYFALGVALEKLDRLEEARTAYMGAIQIKGRSALLYAQAVARLKRRLENRELIAPATSQPAVSAGGAGASGQQ